MRGLNKRQRQAKEAGAILITTLMIMAIMAAIAVNRMSRTAELITLTRLSQSADQITWYHRGAEDLAGQYVRQYAPELTGPSGQALLSTFTPLVYPIDDGFIQLSLFDASTCLPYTPQLNGGPALVTQRWAESVGMLPELDRILDWQDADQQVRPGGAEDYAFLQGEDGYRTPDSPATSRTELRQAFGASAQGQPSVDLSMLCGYPSPAGHSVNINSLVPEQGSILAALLGGEMSAAQGTATLESRPQSGWVDMDALLPNLAQTDSRNILVDNIGFSPRLVGVDIQTQYQGQYRRRVLFFDLEANPAMPFFKTAEFSPVILGETDEETEGE